MMIIKLLLLLIWITCITAPTPSALTTLSEPTTTPPPAPPSSEPSRQPSSQPSRQPSSQPSRQPSSDPSSRPSSQPSSRPSSQPSSWPSVSPSGQPSTTPSSRPSSQPSSRPSSQPSCQPSLQPTSWPTSRPSSRPYSIPSSQPTNQPSNQPSRQPSIQPTTWPSSQPSSQPSSVPSSQPTSQPTKIGTIRYNECGRCGFTETVNGNTICGFHQAPTVFTSTNNYCNFTGTNYNGLQYNTFLILGANITVKGNAQLFINVANFTFNGGRIKADYFRINASSTSINNGSIYANSVQIYSSKFILNEGIISSTNSANSCIQNTTSSGLLSCSNAANGYPWALIPNSIILVSKTLIQVNSGSLRGSFILACSQRDIILTNGLMNTTGLGCGYTKNNPTCSSGGVGGGNCGKGGSTNQCPGTTGECQINSNVVWPAGSIGTCPNNNGVPINGGGIIVIYGLKNFVFNGILESNGQSQINTQKQCGGGAGGAIVVNTTYLSGNGSIVVNGGNISDNTGKSSAGGGGFVFITNPTNSTTYNGKYNSTTYVAASGGIVTTDQTLTTQEGTVGALWLPLCQSGNGNFNENGIYQFCQSCGNSGYSNSGSSTCQACQYADVYNHYKAVNYSATTKYACTIGYTNPPQCCYTCEPGFVGSKCENQFVYFLHSKGGIAAIILVSFSLISSVLYAIKYHFYDKKRKWLKTKEEDFITKVLYGTANFAADFRFEDDNDSALRKKLIANPLLEQSHAEISLIEKPRYSPRLFLKGNLTHTDIRLAWRLHDHDLPYHACRINFVGSNELLDRRGGQWRLPPNRPVCLRPMLRKGEYERFANSINKAVAWSFFSVEALILVISFFLNPFFSLYIQFVFKKRRAHKLIQLIAEYNHDCFRSYAQRESKNSIRIGISPDCSLAYIDILCDRKETKPSRLPLCPIGQPALPVAVVFSGLGSFRAPYSVDSNDVLVQAICDNDLCTAFIDGSWINFIADLNKHLRTIQRHRLFDGIKNLLRFLKDPKTLEPLGGLVINLCSFPNDVNSIPDEVDYKSDMKKKTTIIDEKFEEIEAEANIDKVTEFNHRRSMITGAVEFMGKMKNMMDIGLEEFDNIDKYSTWTVDNENSNASRIFEEYDDKKIKKNRIEDIPDDKFAKKNKNKKCIDGIEKSIKHIANSAFSIFASLYQTNDDIGSNYNDLIWSILTGQSKLGIIITHPKAVNNKIQFNSFDYTNDTRSDYDTDPNVRRISNISKNELRRDSNVFSSRHSDASDDDTRRDTELSVYRSTDYEGQATTSAAELYGDKAEEISKYYNIVYKAEGVLGELDRNNNKDKKGSFLFRKKAEIVKPKSDVTYEQFMKRSFFTSDNVDDEIENYTSIGKDIPQNIMHLKGNVSKSLITEIISLQYNSILFLAPSGLQCPLAKMWEGDKLEELSCVPLNCFISFPSRANSPINVKNSPEMIKSRTTSNERADSLIEDDNNVISILHQSNDDNNINLSSNRAISTSNNATKIIIPKSFEKTQHSTIPPKQSTCIRKFVIAATYDIALRIYLVTRYLLSYSFFGVNVLPYGDPRYVFPILRILVFLTSLLEAFCFFFISTFYLYIWTASSSNYSPTALILALSVPPLAIVLNPILGIFTCMIGRSQTIVQAFAAFSRSASLSTIIILIIYIKKRHNLCLEGAGNDECTYHRMKFNGQQILPCGMYVFGLCLNKAFQVFITDLYASHVENFRLSRGWDGLSTSLTPTTDRL